MKKLITILSSVLIAAAGSAGTAKAQLYEIANQLPQLISPALSGSFNYRGYLEAAYLQGMGDTRANFLDFSTSQGFRYSSWFFMGVGIGADILFSDYGDDNKIPRYGTTGGYYGPNSDFDYNHSSRTTAVMIPIFTDFRLNIGGTASASMFIDLKIGCSFLCSKDYIRINNGYLTNQEYFYLRPSVGVRIPMGGKDSKTAMNLGVTYQLLTSNYWSSWSRNITLNSLGANLSFEW